MSFKIQMTLELDVDMQMLCPERFVRGGELLICGYSGLVKMSDLLLDSSLLLYSALVILCSDDARIPQQHGLYLWI